MAFFPPKTVKEALAGFTKMIADLERIHDEQDAKFSDIGEQIMELEGHRHSASEEARRAYEALNKIKELVGEV